VKKVRNGVQFLVDSYGIRDKRSKTTKRKEKKGGKVVVRRIF